MSTCGTPLEEGWRWRETGSLETSCSAANFLSGVEVWLKRPQVINRRLLGAVLMDGDWDVTPDAGGASETNERIFIRQLLPRSKSVDSRNEAVSIHNGRCDEMNL